MKNCVGDLESSTLQPASTKFVDILDTSLAEMLSDLHVIPTNVFPFTVPNGNRP